MGRFLLALSLLLVFVTATGFCQSFNSAQKSEIEEIVRNVVRDEFRNVVREELQSFYRQQPIPVTVSPTPVINISTNTISIAPGRNELTEPGLSRREDIIALIASKNRRTPRCYIEEVVDTYLIEAKFECINHDIAIAQMLYATDFLNNEQRKEIYNYSGLLNVSFCNMTTGIRAHIQHLKFYAIGNLVDNRRNVDPRYPILRANGYLGKVKSLEDLCRRWSETPGYLSNIRSMLVEMNHFAVYRR
jgi:hypothetical protein